MKTFGFAALAGLLLGAAQEGTSTSPTFSKHVAPIFFKNCVSCHRPGEIGPFPLLGYADAKKRSRLIAEVVGKRVMPPWKPDPGHGDFLDARSLSDAEIALIELWAKSGALEGDPKDLPPKPTFVEGWKLGTPDKILKVEKPYKIPAEGKDVYAHFVFPLSFKEEVFLNGIEVMPGNRRVVHHAIGILDASGTARTLWNNNGKQPYVGSGGPGFVPAGFTPGYVPGQTPRIFKEGTAITIKPGTDLVLQIHYHPSGKVELDQTQVGLHFTPVRPTRSSVIAIMASEDIDIPAGDADYRASDTFTLPVDMEVTTIWAHMHMIGKKVQVLAEQPDGTVVPLLRISDWDFNWQDTYVYKEPFKLPRGTKLTADFVWDNSTKNPRNPNRPPKRVGLGEGSEDEMSGIIIAGHPNNGLEEIGHWLAVVGHYFEIKNRPKRQPK